MFSINWQAYHTCSEAEKFIVEWKFGMTGGFKMALLETIARADTENLEKLRAGFPAEVEGYLKYSRETGWWEELKNRVSVSEK